MNQEILYSIIYAFAFGLIISTSEILYRTGRVKAEITRKLAHSAACLLSLSFPLVYNSYEPVLIMDGLLPFADCSQVQTTSPIHSQRNPQNIWKLPFAPGHQRRFLRIGIS